MNLYQNTKPDVIYVNIIFELTEDFFKTPTFSLSENINLWC